MWFKIMSRYFLLVLVVCFYEFIVKYFQLSPYFIFGLLVILILGVGFIHYVTLADVIERLNIIIEDYVTLIMTTKETSTPIMEVKKEGFEGEEGEYY